MPTVKVGRLNMYYEVHGKGEPLVLITGLSGNSTAWGFQLAAFTKRFKVIIFDNRGAGRTDYPKGNYSIELFAKDTVGLMDKLGIENAHFLGHSMGGAISQRIALSNPRRVKSLVLVGTWARGDNYLSRIFDIFADAARNMPKDAFTRMITPFLFTPTFFQKRADELREIERLRLKNPQTVDAYLRQVAACKKHDTLRSLSRIKAPTLIVVGKEELLTPVRFSRVLADKIKGSKLEVVDGAGHGVFWEVPKVFNKMVLNFLR